MAQGISLDDPDREPWLSAVRERILPFQGKEAEAVLACSALKQKYRDLLSRGTRIQWVYLKGDRAILETRLKDRKGHFASPNILSGQLVDLEEPPNALWIDIRPEPIILVEEILRRTTEP
jgi:gluconokinase